MYDTVTLSYLLPTLGIWLLNYFYSIVRIALSQRNQSQ